MATQKAWPLMNGIATNVPMMARTANTTEMMNTAVVGGLVSKGFLSDKNLVAKLDATLKLKDVDLDQYDAVGGGDFRRLAERFPRSSPRCMSFPSMSAC